MTKEQRRRIVEALLETEQLLDKEMRYSPDLRKPEYLVFLNRHIAKLGHYLATGEMPKTFVRS